jgi:hypothetical protein
MRRAPDGGVKLASPTNIGNRMISLDSMRRVARHTRIGIRTKPPAIAIILDLIVDSPQVMP